MKAIVYDPLRLEEVDKPTPADGEVLIRVRAAGTNPLDWRIAGAGPTIRRLMSAARKSKSKVSRPGADVAGVVEAIGSNVTRFHVGDAVFGAAPGAFAEYACTAEARLALKPAEATFEQAAALPVAGLTALQALRDTAHLQAGQSVLINGAAGGVGTFAVQIAKSFGAEVTGVCSARNAELVRGLGADRVIDYAAEDFARGDRKWDVLLDCVGNRSLSDCLRVVKPGGAFIPIGAPHGSMLRVLPAALWTAIRSRFNKHIMMMMAAVKPGDLETLAKLVESGKVTPMIDRTYPLAEVPEALRYLEAGHARGKVVISLS